MKNILIASLLGSSLMAGNIGLTGFAYSNHKDKGYNEQQNWIGVRYSKKLEDSLIFTSEIATFKNSYNDRTYILGGGLSYMPFSYNDFSFGANLTIGVQKGYCMNGLSNSVCEDSQDDKGVIVIPSFEINYNLDGYRNAGVNITYSDGLLMRFYFDLVSW